MKVSVVVPVYNEEKYLRACLQSLVDQIDEPDEIIVVNNNSTDKSMEIAKQFPVRIILQPQQGITPTRNLGFDSAKYDIIARTDADTIVPTDWVKRLKKDLSGPRYVAVSGRAYFYNIPHFIKNPYWPTSTLKSLMPHDWIFGPNMAVKKTAWEKVKPSLCVDDKEVHEDIDLGIHLGQMGRVKYDTKLVVASSPRRWKKLESYFEYPYRYIKTIQIHRRTITQTQTRNLKKKIKEKTNLLRKPIQQLTDF